MKTMFSNEFQSRLHDIIAFVRCFHDGFHFNTTGSEHSFTGYRPYLRKKGMSIRKSANLSCNGYYVDIS